MSARPQRPDRKNLQVGAVRLAGLRERSIEQLDGADRVAGVHLHSGQQQRLDRQARLDRGTRLVAWRTNEAGALGAPMRRGELTVLCADGRVRFTGPDGARTLEIGEPLHISAFPAHGR